MARRQIKTGDSEASTHERIVRFMHRDHPFIIFHTDFAAGLHLPIWLAARQKKLQFKRGFPDLFIFHPVGTFKGLALEIKKSGVNLKRLDGEWVSQHIKEQFQMLTLLSEQGYACAFAVGYDEAVDIIDNYLKGISLEFKDFMLINRSGPTLIHEQEGPF